YELDINDPAITGLDFDPTQIAQIEVVVDRNLVGDLGKTGAVFIQFKELITADIIAPAAFDATALTTLGNSPLTAATGSNVDPGNNLLGVASLNQTSEGSYEVHYDVSMHSAAFVINSIRYGFF